MTSRRELIGAIAGLGLSMTAMPSWAQDFTPIAGKDYTVVRPPLPYAQRPILIHDFFAYTCPHCLQFEPVMSRFVEEARTMADVRIVPVPVAWNESYSVFPRVYFAFESMKRMDDLHPEFWQWVIRGEHDWKDSADVEAGVLDWVAQHGVNKDQFKKLINSFAIVSKYRTATQTWKQYGVDSTPCVGIAGRFITAPHLTGTRSGTIDVVKYLIDTVRKESAK